MEIFQNSDEKIRNSSPIALSPRQSLNSLMKNSNGMILKSFSNLTPK